MPLRLYVVKHGDFPANVAQLYTGDSLRHDELLDANPEFAIIDRRGRPTWRMLKTGDVLTIPTAWPSRVNDTPTVPEIPNPPTVEPPPLPPPAPVVITGAPRRLSPAVTTATVAELSRALVHSWGEATAPSADGLAVLVAQWALETGWGKSCHAWNLGNVKSVQGDGHDYTFFACWEVLTKAQAASALATATLRADGTGPNVTTGKARNDGKVEVWFYPDHPGCRFRAFDSLEHGAAAYLAKLRSRFARAWPYVEAGDPSGFAAALKSQGYFTAPLDGADGYRPLLVGIYNRVVKQVASAIAT